MTMAVSIQRPCFFTDDDEREAPFRPIRIDDLVSKRPFVALFGILPAIGVYRYRRNRLSLRIGLCKCCGYDLRVTPERCPECGMATVNREHDAGKPSAPLASSSVRGS